MIFRRLLLLAVALLPTVSFAQAPSWEPARTWVFAASVVRWKDPGLASFTSHRLDGQLIRTAKDAGVPAKNIRFLQDDQATLEAVRAGLVATAQEAAPGSTLIFYFQGHGLRRKGKTTLAIYDVDLKSVATTGLSVDEVGDVLEQHFKGGRVLLFGDCCHSGALGEVAQRLAKRGVKAAALTSSLVSNRSTGHWTYTEGLIAALGGDAHLDRDRSGAVTFDEVTRYVRDEMKFAEGQLSFSALAGGFEPGFVLRTMTPLEPAKASGPWKVGDYVRAKDREGQWYGARVLEAGKGAWKVHYPGWDPKWDERISSDRIKAIETSRLEVGRRYEVEWEKGQWYLATVLRGQDDFFWFVHYAGEAGDDDEWVTPQRVRPAPAGAEPEFALAEPASFKVGQTVAARWKKSWYLATITARTGDGLWRVHYADDTVGAVLDDELMPLAAAVSEGDRVLACWAGKPQMYGGRVVSAERAAAKVAWDDGSAATKVPLTQVARVRDVRR